MAVVAGSVFLSPFTSAATAESRGDVHLPRATVRALVSFSRFGTRGWSSTEVLSIEQSASFVRGLGRTKLSSKRSPRLSSKRFAKAHGEGKQIGPVSATIAPPRPSLNPEKGAEEENDDGESVGTRDVVEDENIQERPETREEEAAFVWRENWYPVSLIEDLDSSVPTPFQLLGRELVVWKDQQGEWRVFEDKCPHRLAPLSEGRLDESGMLQCSYHGWSFKGDGSCGAIPQAASEGPEAKARFSPRACAIIYPTLVSQGLLFVWPDGKGLEKASVTPPPMLPPEFDDPNYSSVTIQRDLYYGYDTLMENVSDPSHIDFAHHKVTGRRDRAKPLPFKVEKSGPWGFKGANNDTPKITAGFYPPCYYYNKIELPVKLPFVGEKNWEILICSFNIPMAPGKTRSIVCSARNFFRFTMPGPAWWQLVPRWHEHWTSNKVYDGDMIVLQGQEKGFLAQGGDVNAQYSKFTFTPTQADRFVLAFRNWLRKHGKSQPDWFPEANLSQPLPSTVLSKYEMLDRYEQHTLKCASCRTALAGFRTWQKVFWGSTIILAAGAGVPPDLALRALLAVGSISSAALAYILKEKEKNFIFTDYNHSKID
ncbi:hypothetical protein BDL97_02G099000 [Sphagnum fallax]|nr:hypothetical protein BDL97_02G099000 [Sphagnum fallax]KAH8970650.1 hypothetical protein BDL97_02G099000 [Sphagnum fallax]